MGLPGLSGDCGGDAVMTLHLDEGTNQDAMLIDLLSAHIEYCEEHHADEPEGQEEIKNCQILIQRLDP